MQILTAEEADQRFADLLDAVERGETIHITRKGRTIAELRPRNADKRDDPAWRAAYERMVALMNSWPTTTGYRVGKITEDDRYGDAPIDGGPYANKQE